MPDGKTYFRCFTKSLFNLAHECPTKLYYYNKAEYPSDKKDDEFLRTLAEGGFQVGALAKCYFPEGVEVVSLEQEEALRLTETLLKEDEITIFEAAVRFEDFFARVDILRKTGNHLDLIEVKSKSYHPKEDMFVNQKGQIEPKWHPYLHDVAFQTCVLEQAFSQFTVSPYLMLVDKSTTTSVDGLNQKFRLIKGKGRSEVVITGNASVEALGSTQKCRRSSVSPPWWASWRPPTETLETTFPKSARAGFAPTLTTLSDPSPRPSMPSVQM